MRDCYVEWLFGILYTFSFFGVDEAIFTGSGDLLVVIILLTVVGKKQPQCAFKCEQKFLKESGQKQNKIFQWLTVFMTEMF